eukprot:11863-Heterococcus_DN1.PRE.1
MAAHAHASWLLSQQTCCSMSAVVCNNSSVSEVKQRPYPIRVTYAAPCCDVNNMPLCAARCCWRLFTLSVNPSIQVQLATLLPLVLHWD